MKKRKAQPLVWCAVGSVVLSMMSQSGFGATPESIRIFQHPESVSFPIAGGRTLSLSLKGDPFIVLKDRSGTFTYQESKDRIIQTYRRTVGKRELILVSKESKLDGAIKVGLIAARIGEMKSETAPAQRTVPPSSASPSTRTPEPPAIKSFTGYIASEVLDESCNSGLPPNLRSEYKKVVGDFFSGEKSYLVKCLSDAEAIAKLKNQRLDEEIVKVINSYHHDINELKSGLPSFRMACEEIGEGPAAFTAKYSSEKKQIIFPVRDENFVPNGCFPVNTAFLHEYLHHVGLTSESTVQIFDTVCAKANRVSAAENPACRKQFVPLRENRMAVQTAISQAARRNIERDRAAMAPAVREEMQRARNQRVAKADVDAVREVALADNRAHAQAQDRANGVVPSRMLVSVHGDLPPPEPHTPARLESVSMSADQSAETSQSASSSSSSSGGSASRWPTVGSAVDRLSRSMSRNLNNMALAADRAISIVESPAQASTTAKPSKRRSPALADNPDRPKAQEYKVEEILADQSLVLQTAQGPRRPQTLAQTRAQASDETKSKEAATNSKLADSPRAARPSAGSIGAATSSSRSAQSGGMDSTRISSTPSRGPASTLGTSGSSNNIPSLIPQVILSRQREIQGEQYLKISSSYQDRAFQAELSRNNLRIVVPASDSAIGSNRTNAVVYTDTGNSLVLQKR